MSHLALESEEPAAANSFSIGELTRDIDVGSETDDDDDYLMDTDDELLEESRTMNAPKSDLESLGTVMPRRSFKGICNVETVKDVNFLGPNDNFVVSGSDDGSFFIWDKQTSRLQGIYEGDGSVVNVIEQHPFLPMVAVSGIDTTVKIFSPVPSSRERQYSRTASADDIVRQNTQRAEAQANAPAVPLMDVLIQMYAARGGRNVVTSEEEERECRVQ